MYRFLVASGLLLAVFAFKPAQVRAQCYVCNREADLCEDEGPDPGCVPGSEGIKICEGGVCTTGCREYPGHCTFFYGLLEPYGITPADEVTFETADHELVALLPVPGEEDLYGHWTCEGDLLQLYRRVDASFDLVTEPEPYAAVTSLTEEHQAGQPWR